MSIIKIKISNNPEKNQKQEFNLNSFIDKDGDHCISVAELYENIPDINISLKRIGSGGCRIERYWKQTKVKSETLELVAYYDPQITSCLEYGICDPTVEFKKATLRTHLVFNDAVRYLESEIKGSLSVLKRRADVSKLFESITGGRSFIEISGLKPQYELPYAIVEETRQTLLSQDELQKLRQDEREKNKRQIEEIYGKVLDSNEWGLVISLEEEYASKGELDRFFVGEKHLRGWKIVRERWLKVEEPSPIILKKLAPK